MSKNKKTQFYKVIWLDYNKKLMIWNNKIISTDWNVNRQTVMPLINKKYYKDKLKN